MIASIPVVEARHAPLDPQSLARLVLSQKRFHIAIPATHRTLWQVVWDAFVRLFSKWVDALATRVHFGNLTAMVVGDLLVVILIAVVAIITLRLLLASRPATQKRIAAEPLAPIEDVEFLHARSLHFAQQGDYRMAIALIFRATLLRLERLGLVGAGPSRTVNEYRRVLGSRARTIAPMFDAIARPFSTAFYAEQIIGQSEWLNAHDAYVRLPDSP